MYSWGQNYALTLHPALPTLHPLNDIKDLEMPRKFKRVSKKPAKKKISKTAQPSEHSEQVLVVRRLQTARPAILFCAVPNGGRRSKHEGAKLRAEGMRRGVPDLLIFSAPPALEGKVGTALEMKRQKGGRLSAEQKEWLKAVEDQGWHTIVGRGAKDALEQLASAGYAVRWSGGSVQGIGGEEGVGIGPGSTHGLDLPEGEVGEEGSEEGVLSEQGGGVEGL